MTHENIDLTRDSHVSEFLDIYHDRHSSRNSQRWPGKGREWK